MTSKMNKEIPRYTFLLIQLSNLCFYQNLIILKDVKKASKNKSILKMHVYIPKGSEACWRVLDFGGFCN